MFTHSYDLVLRVLPRVRKRVLQLARREDAADLYQEVLLRILESLPSYRGDGRFEAWVDAVTTRVTLRALVRGRTDRRRLEDAVDIATPSQPGIASPHQALSGVRAVDALQRVAAKQQAAIVMHYVLGMTVTEMSNELQVPVETIRSRLRVGMGQVRAELGVV
jgi:RNA polymerase sigma-70 factor (ECF subfamily)